MSQPTLRLWSRGPTVKGLQEQLNGFADSLLPPLTPDGIFGAKTLARVREFQAQRGLTADGIVGPNTWGKLAEQVPAPPPTPEPHGGTACGCGDPSTQSQIPLIQKSLIQTGAKASLGPGLSPPKFSTGGLPAARRITPAQIATAKPVYADSIDWAKVFITDVAAVNNRPFVVAVPVDPATALLLGLPPVPTHVQVVNCKTLTPDSATLIHELAHVWQSQHHFDPKQYMINCLASQQWAIQENQKAGYTHTDFPFSAYASHPGGPFSAYAGEQIAYQAEANIPSVVAHLKSVTKNTVDGANIAGLSKPRIQDVRLSGVLR